jgi:hypothetical protein
LQVDRVRLANAAGGFPGRMGKSPGGAGMGMYEDTELLGAPGGGGGGGGLGMYEDTEYLGAPPPGRPSLAGGGGMGMGLYEDTEFLGARPVAEEAAAEEGRGPGSRGTLRGGRALPLALMDSPMRPGVVARADEFEVALQATPLKEQQAPLTPDKVGGLGWVRAGLSLAAPERRRLAG